MTNTFETETQQCDVTTNSFHVEKPCNGSNATIALSNDAPTKFEFGLNDISGFQLLEDGSLLISFVDGDETLIIENYAAMAESGQFQEVALSDGETINLAKLAEGLSSPQSPQVANNEIAQELATIEPVAGDELATVITKDNEYTLNAGETYQTDFNQSDIATAQLDENGNLIITFVDETQTTITNFKDIESAQDIPTMTLADGSVIPVTDLLTQAVSLSNVDGETDGDAGDVVAVQQPTPTPAKPVQNNVEEEIALVRPEDLAEIEPAAGDATAPAGALGNTGANFGSSVSDIGLGAVNAVGPIGVTSLSFDRPEFEDDDFFLTSPVTNPPLVILNDAIGYEDNAINFGVSAQSSDPAECVEVIIENIPAGWTPVLTDPTTAAGVFDATAGTWTLTLGVGETLTSGPVFLPPKDSDEDITPIQVTVNQKDPTTLAVTSTSVNTFNVIVDAVADPINLIANDVSAPEDTPAKLDLTATLQDVDGSEEITEILICNIPAGFVLSAGTEVSPGNYLVSQADLATLELLPPANYSGTLNLEIKVTNEEVNFSDTEFDFTNNDNVTTLPFDVTFTPVADAPNLEVGDVQVKEDGTVDLPIKAELTDTSETLTVRVQNLDNTWGVSIGANNGVYNAATGMWEITLPAGQNYDGSITLTPPADSDGDMPNILVQAISTESDGTIAQTSDTVNVITDAVADMPNLDAGSNKTVEAGQSVALNISNSLTDTDGSESLGNVTISGVPTGYSLSAGTEVSPGVWEVAQGDLAGLMLNTPVNGNGNITLSVSVTSTESVTDGEIRLDNNTATNTDTVVISVNPDRDPPEVTFGANGSGQGEVYEDGSVFVPITGTLSGVSPQVLTVTVSGIDPTWTIATGANNGTYNAATGTWTITMPSGQNYAGGLTFTPPADSDVDLTGLTVTATSELVSDGTTTSTTTSGAVIVDAVADMPNLDAGSNKTVEAGQSVALNISNSLTDTDGSESLGNVTISGVPTGYSLSAGTEVSPGVWEVAQGDLAGLMLNTPVNGNGNITLSVSVTSTESVTDGEIRLDNNTATNTDTVVISVNPDRDPPEVTFGANGSGQGEVYEDGSVFVPITGTLSGVSPQVLTVTVSGIDPTWTIATGANNGTYNAATGTWTITMPAGQNYAGGLTFTPPADSDVDLTGLTVTATSELVSDGTTTSTTTSGAVIVDAVADMPNLDAGSNKTVEAGQSVALNISNSLTDTDGSESLGNVTISGVPTGYSLSAGTEVSPGVWEVAQGDLAGLMLNTPVNGNGNITLSVSVTSTESVTDGEIRLDNNTATNTDTVVISVNPDRDPPEVTFGANGSGQGEVYEDGSVFVPITGTLSGVSPQVLTVTVSGIDPTWTIATGANNGTYNAATGTWTITMPAGQNYAGGLTFTPPADSDVDLTGLTVTATSELVSDGTTTSTTTSGAVIVDAVADMPNLDAGSNKTVEAGQSVALNISNSLTDTDGSESLGNVTISGVPTGYSLSAGTEVSPGVWEVAQGDLAGLMLNTPVNGNGNITLSVSVTSTESVTDGEIRLDNNTATNTDTVVISVNPDRDPPEVTFGANGSGQGEVYEDGSVFVPITGTLSGVSPQVLTVTVSGIDPTWTIATGANNGTYNAATGTWTITMPAGQNYAGGLTFTPPADSDVDLTGLTVTATSELVSDGTTTSTTTSGAVIVDAVADMPNLDAGSNKTVEAGQSVALNISNSLTDTDGSESLGNVTISGVPTGYSLSAGTEVSPGVWEVAQGDLAGLMLNTPVNGNGNITLSVSVTSTESVTDGEIRLDNNTATNTDTVVISVNPDRDPPEVTFGANGSGQGEVYEDGSVFVPITGTLSGVSPQVLTVTVSGIDPTWTIATGANNGTYNAATGTWTITMPAGQNYAGGLTFTPPADSDVDLTGLTVTATSELVSDGTTTSTTTSGAVIVDAVADMPNLDAGSNKTVEAGQSVALNISNSLTDTDGSESLGNVTISGVPTGYSLSAGTEVSPGVWEVAQGDLAGLMLNTPVNGNGNITLSVSVTSTESVTDGEIRLDNNTATNTDTVVISVNPDDKPIVTNAYDTVDETNLVSGAITETGTVSANFGIDGPGRFELNGSFQAEGSVLGDLSHKGKDIIVDRVGDTYTGKAGNIDVFTMKINTDGTFKFTLLENLDHSDPNLDNEAIKLKFGFDAVDNNGDRASGIVSIHVKDDVPSIYDKAKPIDEDGLDYGPISYTHTLVHSYGEDGKGSIKPTGDFRAKFQVGGPDVTLTSNDVTISVSKTSTGYVGKAGSDTIFKLTVNDNGQYTYTQYAGIDHPDTTNPDDVIWLKFKVAITDFDGDTKYADIIVDVADSGPKAIDDTTQVHEGQMVTGNVISNDTVGADDPATVTMIAGKAVTATGTSIVGQYGTLTIQKDGAYTYTANSNNPDGVDTFTYVLTDADGDVDTAKLTITVTSDNDIPKVTGSQEVVDETNLLNGTISELGNVTADFGADGPGRFVLNGRFTSSGADNGNLTHNGVDVVVTRVGDTYFGKAGTVDVFTLKLNANGSYEFNLIENLDHNDPTQSDEIIKLNFGFDAIDADGDRTSSTIAVSVKDDVPSISYKGKPIDEDGLASADVISYSYVLNHSYGEDGAGTIDPTGIFEAKLQSGGANILLKSGGVDITIKNTANGYVGMAGDTRVFDLYVNDNGQYTYRQFEGIDHPDTTNPDDIVMLRFGVSITDYEGDTANAMIVVDVHDSAPVAVDDTTQVHEDQMVTGNVISNDIVGADDPATITMVAGKVVGDHGLTVVGQYGTLFIEKDGSYKYTANGNNPDGVDAFSYLVMDADGDSDIGKLRVTVTSTNSVPVAKSDIVTMWSCDWATIGNVITGYNQDNSGADTLSADGGTELKSVTFGGQTYNFKEGGDSMVVKLDYGTIFMFKDGTYSYISEQAKPLASHTENLSYTLKDADGDTSTATLQVRVKEVNVTQNETSDYGNQTSGPNTFVDGEPAYRTDDADGAQVFGYTADDIIMGNKGNDALYGWTGDDMLYGARGNDVLLGEYGNNTLDGGQGADIFGIAGDKVNNNDKFDTIMDFNLFEGDVLSLSAVISGFGSGDDINDFVRLNFEGDTAVVQVNTDGSGTDFYDVAKIKSHADLDATSLNVQDLFDKGHIDIY